MKYSQKKIGEDKKIFLRSFFLRLKKEKKI